MKKRQFETTRAVLAVSSALLTWQTSGQNSPDANGAPQLPYAAAQVLQLEQAKISDGTIIAYIKNSRNSCSLEAGQILYLRQQGISDAVLKAMLSQPKAAVGPANVPVPSAPAPQNATPAPVAPATPATAPPAVSVQPSVTLVQPSQPADAVVAVPGPPPPARADVMPVAPGPLSLWVWAPGRWVWHGHWVWFGGCWARRPHPDAVWVGGRWDDHRRVYVEAHWR